jgi:hypothetical protein
LGFTVMISGFVGHPQKSGYFHGDSQKAYILTREVFIIMMKLVKITVPVNRHFPNIPIPDT